MSETNNLPKSLVVNKADVKAAARKDVISNEGWFKLAITRGENRAGSGKAYENGKEVGKKVSRLQMVLTLAPLRKANDPKSVVHELALKKYLVLPDVAPDSIEPDAAVEEQARGKITKSLAKDLRAIFGVESVPYAPRKGDGGRYEYDGEEIDKEDYDKALEDLSEKALEVAYKMWSDPERWLTPKKFVYAKITQKLQGDGTKQPNINFITDKLPEDASLLEASEWFKAPATE